MNDLTQGSVTRHLLNMGAFMAVSMLFQTLYLLADLYWVGSLGKEAIAAVGVAGNLMMIVLALTQMLGVGTTTLISQAAGKKDQPRAEFVFNQSFLVSLLIGITLGIAGFLIRDAYCKSLSADALTATLAKKYLGWFILALCLQFPLVTLGSALRATGIIKPAVLFQVMTVILNIILAPILIFHLKLSWHFPYVVDRALPRMGVSGAALATFISILIGNLLMAIYFETKYHFLRFRINQMRPQLKTWIALLRIGGPSGAEFVLLFFYIFVVYIIIRPFGADAQAGFGIGARVMQAMFLPVLALSFAVAPVVGQNFGGRRGDRVKETVYAALKIASSIMLILTLLAWIAPATLIRVFSKDANVISFGSDYLRIISLNFVAAGIVFTVSSVFQGIGNTWPPLLSSLTRLFLFALPALAISRKAGFEIKYVWYLSVASQLFQAGLNLLLLRHQLRNKLTFSEAGALAVGSAPAS